MAACTLLLGPLLRHVGETDATVWVETDRPCTVEVLGQTETTFTVAGHHYALLVLDGLEPASATAYDVRLDGAVAWPAEGEPGGLIRTLGGDGGFTLAFGSCRVSLPHEEPYTLTKDEDPAGREVDALVALGRRMGGQPPGRWPDALLLVGDQVYADEVSPAIAERIAARRDPTVGAGEEVADFEEYTWLYREAWGDPALRWMLSVLPTSMIFDDHDVHDDWNTSGTWERQMRATDWWEDRIIGAYVSYWIYQHLGNLAPADLREHDLFQRVRAMGDEDAWPELRRYACEARDEVAGTRWSFVRDFGTARMVVLDSRAGRIIADDTQRQMLSDEQWAWAAEHLTGDVDHLLVATTLPLFLAPGLHALEGWNEAVCAGAWGRGAAWAGEKIRQALDLEHWAAFRSSFDHLVDELRAVGAGERGAPPASIVLLSGDVHHAYLAEVGYPRAAGVQSAVVQAVCSPVRNPLDHRERRMLRGALSTSASIAAGTLARLAGVREPAVRWRFPEAPTFDNQIASLSLRGRAARLTIEKTSVEDRAAPRLHCSLDRIITGG
ncbi:alkaline phosphatase family protein [Paraconexibacter antarcticus]|uniref:Alkaline phosphatase family protein n=1 Tax=Paraconexibacter antarcticus TaxID=2949664 RepID=A0ABY5DWB1_9ACTN|nr:alkaline phosphatase D family protein [Paraconexibacter antarcticus]UTI65219.1 alkaline phosphatase family protein [Paraconexibacter antarcticus]